MVCAVIDRLMIICVNHNEAAKLQFFFESDKCFKEKTRNILQIFEKEVSNSYENV